MGNGMVGNVMSPDARTYEHLFGTEHIAEQLGAKSIRGGLNTLVAEGASFVLRLGATTVLARLLIPEHFGLIAMVTAITAIAERSKDLGLSTATVQRKELSHEQVSALFWINTGLGTLLMLIVAASSPAIAWFYGDHRLVAITLALSSSFFFGGLTVQHEALLRRQMRFGQLACIQIISTLLSLAVSVWLAWQGFGYWALVWKEVARSVCFAAGTWYLCRWRPSMSVRNSGIAPMLRFGGDITTFNIMHHLSRSLDQILVGRLWGAGPLGFYRQANQLVSVTINQLQFPVDYVAEPLLSTLQKEPDRYRESYRKIISALSFAMMPLAMYLIVYSEELVMLLLGNKWLGSVAIFRMLAIAAFIQPVASTGGFVMVTCGKSGRYVRWGIMSAISVIAAVCVGAYWGPLGVATAYAIRNYITCIPFLRFSFRDTPVSIPLFFEAISIPVFSSLLMGAVLMGVSPQIEASHNLLKIPLSLLLASSSYLGIWLLFPGGKQKLAELSSYLLVTFKTVPHGKK